AWFVARSVCAGLLEESSEGETRLTAWARCSASTRPIASSRLVTKRELVPVGKQLLLSGEGANATDDRPAAVEGRLGDLRLAAVGVVGDRLPGVLRDPSTSAAIVLVMRSPIEYSQPGRPRRFPFQNSEPARNSFTPQAPARATRAIGMIDLLQVTVDRRMFALDKVGYLVRALFVANLVDPARLLGGTAGRGTLDRVKPVCRGRGCCDARAANDDQAPRSRARSSSTVRSAVGSASSRSSGIRLPLSIERPYVPAARRRSARSRASSCSRRSSARPSSSSSK